MGPLPPPRGDPANLVKAGRLSTHLKLLEFCELVALPNIPTVEQQKMETALKVVSVGGACMFVSSPFRCSTWRKAQASPGKHAFPHGGGPMYYLCKASALRHEVLNAIELMKS